MPDEPTPQLDGAEHREKHLPDVLKANIWKKGQSGNPNGRPNGAISLKKLLVKILKEKFPGDKEGRKNAEVFVRGEVDRALKGNKEARKMIWDYVEGLPDANVNVTLNDDTRADVCRTVARFAEAVAALAGPEVMAVREGASGGGSGRVDEAPGDDDSEAVRE